MLWKLSLFLLSVVIAIYILINPTFHQLILGLGSLEYLGGFIVGIFWVSSFTVVPSAAALLVLADILNPFLLAVIAGLGAMVGDYIIYRFIISETDRIGKMEKIKNHFIIKRVRAMPIIRYLGVVVGAFIIASPFPDELGIALLGISRLETKKFLPLSFVLNAAGIFVVVGLGKIF